MKRMGRIITAIMVVAFFTTPSLALAGEKDVHLSTDPCLQAKKSHIDAEQEWSSVNAEVKFMRGELERLRSLRWDIRITLAVLDDALELAKEKGSLSPAQRITLNSRIPKGLGGINPDSTFTMTVLETMPVKMAEARDGLDKLLAESEVDIKKTENELKEKEQKSYILSQRVTELEASVEKECKAVGTPTPWEEGRPRLSAEDLYPRYVEKERLRQEEVESRYYADLERLWLRRYSDAPSHLGYQERALLIELRSAGNHPSCFRCYPFKFSWERRRIIEELDKAARHHEHIPCVGELGSFKVIKSFQNSWQCYKRLY